jgi:hypothetical protein
MHLSSYFKMVILIDASPQSIFKSFAVALRNFLTKSGYTGNLYIINPTFSAYELSMIASRGKGLSETLMVRDAYNYASKLLDSSNLSCIKLSARYSVVNSSIFFKAVSSQIANHDLVILRSSLFRQNMTVFYSFRGLYVLRLLVRAAFSSFDLCRPYIEHTFFNEVYSNKFVDSKPFTGLCLFNKSIRSGSHGRRLSSRVQLIHLIATIF